MPEICLITPPDIVHNYDCTILLIYPNEDIKEQMNNVLGDIKGSLNLYLYEPTADEHDPQWLYTVAEKSDIIILDIDNCDNLTRSSLAYFLGMSKTYWLTKGEDLYYNNLSNKRVYDVESIKDKIGGQIAKQQR